MYLSYSPITVCVELYLCRCVSMHSQFSSFIVVSLHRSTFDALNLHYIQALFSRLASRVRSNVTPSNSSCHVLVINLQMVRFEKQSKFVQEGEISRRA